MLSFRIEYQFIGGMLVPIRIPVEIIDEETKRPGAVDPATELEFMNREYKESPEALKRRLKREAIEEDRRGFESGDEVAEEPFVQDFDRGDGNFLDAVISEEIDDSFPEKT